MSALTRLRALLLAALLLWPAAHLGLTLTTDISSWRFGGWGMYATPQGFERTLVVFELGEGPLRPVPVGLLGLELEGFADRAALKLLARGGEAAVDLLDPDAAPRLADDLRRARHLGDLDALARVVATLHAGVEPAPDAVKVMVARQRVDVPRRSAAVEYRRFRFEPPATLTEAAPHTAR